MTKKELLASLAHCPGDAEIGVLLGGDTYEILGMGVVKGNEAAYAEDGVEAGTMGVLIDIGS